MLLRMITAGQLRDAGYTVIEVSNAHEALDVLRDNSLGVHVVFSDIRMPGSLDGVALARAIRSQHPRIKVFLTSGHITALDWVEHDGFFAKPYDVTKIVRHINVLTD